MSTTLVLNADMLPVSVVPLSTVHWQDAIRIIYLDRATVIEEYDYWVVRSPTVKMKMPSVIMLNKYQKHNGKVEFSRYNVILRDNYICQYCHDKFPFDQLTFDHVVPRQQGGKTEWTNIASACYPCNQRKAHHNRMKPMNVPYRPTYWKLADNRKFHPVTIPDDAWKPWIDWKGQVLIDPTIKAQHAADNLVDDELPYI